MSAEDSVSQLERCAYCRHYVPVTRVSVQPDDGPITARVTVCRACLGDGR